MVCAVCEKIVLDDEYVIKDNKHDVIVCKRKDCMGVIESIKDSYIKSDKRLSYGEYRLKMLKEIKLWR